MIVQNNVSLQQISWVKSNKRVFEKCNTKVDHVYFPETIDELLELINNFNIHEEKYDIIGFSSNTLFLPSYFAKNIVCTKKLCHWEENERNIICECGVNIGALSKAMIRLGYVGFEGLTDLPGTIAAAVYGNCGCRGCMVNHLVEQIDLLTCDGKIIKLTPSDLALSYRSSSLKRGEMKGVILYVHLKKNQGDQRALMEKARRNHNYRSAHQPSAVNNLGTTFILGRFRTLKGFFYLLMDFLIRIANLSWDERKSVPKLLKLTHNDRFIPYVYVWNRYMFIDEHSHVIFDEYYDFLKKLYKKVHLEIEIKK